MQAQTALKCLNTVHRVVAQDENLALKLFVNSAFILFLEENNFFFEYF